MFTNKKETAKIQLDPENIPNHIAIIMDGNGRWANKRLMPRVAGHKAGMENVKTITKAASRMGVKVLTLYAFSTENWKRPSDEVNFLMQLPVDFFGTFMPELIEENVRVKVMGNIHALPEKTQKAAQDAMADTAQNTGMILNFALNYGGRDEIQQAVQQIAKDAVSGTIEADSIDDDLISQYLMTGFLGEYADPELLIRTSGEERISNFLLWQIAYSELVFVDEFWPDFTPQVFEESIFTYQQRHRRFGGLK
ncbi:isoprenyl transferase [Latilactobacillus sakei]|uniref:isoprenyl transferase n=1 Tax=Latilactobacillus sakei TaxID=1599 RepID=UPI000A17BDA3|nr:isoprenyl transferase [Latilactobacillus sakei]ARJ71462.1 isoprenyl transferase [Latilactobacillus sakei]AST83823.1 isoprenyl transferase [Latilactobacillus sakei]AWZ41765.1 isoprenyl transferase [Latilactobacillus sakei]QGL59911.1 isoprenyl transferase [Latilactobacillus sakei]